VSGAGRNPGASQSGAPTRSAVHAQRSRGRPASKWSLIVRKFPDEYPLHLLLLPVIAYYIVFHYVPMYGIIISFQDFSLFKGFAGSPWVGLRHFKDFFSSIYFPRLMRNTILLNVYSLIFGFPAPIIFALLLNEIRNSAFKRVIQTVTYLPHFISIAIVVGMMMVFLTPVGGIVNVLIQKLGIEAIPFMQSNRWFRPLYVGSGIWQEFGWGSIIYLAALTAISPALYESARIDGANRFQQMIYITIPSLMPTIAMLLILRIGGMLSVGFDKIILMYNPAIYEVSDVISTYVYRKSIIGGEFSFGTAVGLFNNVTGFILVFLANYLSRKMTEVSLW
jgi:putative aldouronate transport system permease protein